jgi:DNA-binding CsgD family transcriptional regulator
VQLAANGKNAWQIGRHLELSVRTVEGHLARARRRIGVASSAELVARAVASGIVSLGAISARPGGYWRTGEATIAEHLIMFRNLNISEHDQQARDTSGGALRGKRGRPTVMTPDRIEAAAKILSSHTITQIAKKLGVSRGTVHAHMWAIRAVAHGLNTKAE